MFIDLKSLEDQVLVDVRSYEEHISMPLCKYNIPIIDKKEHEFLRGHVYIAIFIILYGFIKNKKHIKEKLVEVSNNKKDTIVIGCSQGRLRSPIIYFYAKSLGIKCEILKGGIKQFYRPRKKNRFLSWFEI